METKDITEKRTKAKTTKTFIIKHLPKSVHRKVHKHQMALTGKPTIEEAAIELLVAGYEKLYSTQTI